MCDCFNLLLTARHFELLRYHKKRHVIIIIIIQTSIICIFLNEVLVYVESEFFKIMSIGFLYKTVSCMFILHLG